MSKRSSLTSKSGPRARHPKLKADESALKRTKLDRMLVLMRRTSGASIDALQSNTGWQAHSIRGALSGLRKKGVPITLVKHAGKPSTYHTTASG